eukprot:7747670-Alexandrium_andersonii.AAC.1
MPLLASTRLGLSLRAVAGAAVTLALLATPALRERALLHVLARVGIPAERFRAFGVRLQAVGVADPA